MSPGSYGLTIDNGGALPQAPNVPQEYQLFAVTPRDLTQDTNEVIVLPTRVLSVTVVDPDGKPVPNVGVAVLLV